MRLTTDVSRWTCYSIVICAGNLTRRSKRERPILAGSSSPRRDEHAHTHALQGASWVMKSDLPQDWPSYAYQRTVNADGIPSEEIVQQQAGSHNGVAQHPGDELLARARDLAQQLSRAA